MFAWFWTQFSGIRDKLDTYTPLLTLSLSLFCHFLCRRGTAHPIVERAWHLHWCRKAKDTALFSQPYVQGILIALFLDLEIIWSDSDLVPNQTYPTLRVFWTSFSFTGNPDDSHHPVDASCTLWDGPDWAGAVQQDSVQDSAWWQQQLSQALWQMSSGSQPGSRPNRQTPSRAATNISFASLKWLVPDGFSICCRCMKKLAQTSTR